MAWQEMGGVLIKRLTEARKEKMTGEHRRYWGQAWGWGIQGEHEPTEQGDWMDGSAIHNGMERSSVWHMLCLNCHQEEDMRYHCAAGQSVS